MERSLTLTTDDGVDLEAEWSPATDPVGTTVLAHPHPEYGGSMDAGLIAVLFALLPSMGVNTLRFNFRGVGRSGGSHGGGQHEGADVEAAVRAIGELSGPGPLLLVGWSFGADVALGVVHPDVAGWVAVAPPLAVGDPATMGAGPDPRPKLLLVPEHDQFRPPDQARSLVEGWVETRVLSLDGADHMVAGAGRDVAEHVLTAITG